MKIQKVRQLIIDIFLKHKLSNKNSKIFLEIRGKKHTANICGLPFYKKSYVKGAA